MSCKSFRKPVLSKRTASRGSLLNQLMKTDLCPAPPQVHGAGCYRVSGRNLAVWLHIHRNVSLLGETEDGWKTSEALIFSSVHSGTSFLPHFGPTKSTTCMDSWCWCWLSSASWLCASPLCARTSCSMLRTTDGEYFSIHIHFLPSHHPPKKRGFCPFQAVDQLPVCCIYCRLCVHVLLLLLFLQNQVSTDHFCLES